MNPLTKEDILAFLQHWYILIDNHAPLEKVLECIDHDRFEMQITDGPMILGAAGFSAWYCEKVTTSFDSVHTVHNVDITLDGNQAEVVVSADWAGRNWIVPGIKSEAVAFKDKLILHIFRDKKEQIRFCKYLVQSAD